MPTDRTLHACTVGSALGLSLSLAAVTEFAQLLAALVSIGIGVYGFWHSARTGKRRGRK